MAFLAVRGERQPDLSRTSQSPRILDKWVRTHNVHIMNTLALGCQISKAATPQQVSCCHMLRTTLLLLLEFQAGLKTGVRSGETNAPRFQGLN